jgi:hypothetical protein
MRSKSALLMVISTMGCTGGTTVTDAAFGTGAPVADGSSQRIPLTPPASPDLESAGVPVDPNDVVYDFSAAQLDSFRYATLQCLGKNSYFWQWGGSSGEYVSPLPNPLSGVGPNGVGFAAFSTVPAPGDDGHSAFRWQLYATDPDTAGAGAKRCEMSFGWKEYSYPGKVISRSVGLPANQDNWWAVAVRLEDLSGTDGTNDWQTLWQWHDGHGGGLAPFLDFAAKGSQLYLQAAYDLNPSPTDPTTTKMTLWNDMRPANTWLRFIVKARKDLVAPQNSFVTVWLDGQQVVDYHGPFGYNVVELDYAKVGIYHWISTANVWNPAVPARILWTQGPVQVHDANGYTWQGIDALLD